jgi:two-component system, OmpR family, phosphate regulon sensor histidine kinase PhoR
MPLPAKIKEREPPGRLTIAADRRQPNPTLVSLGRGDTEHSAGAIGSRLNLQSAIDFQTVLLGLAGHDLRQPLTVIRGTYELLAARARAQCDQDLVQQGEAAVQRLTEQLNRIATAIHLFEQTKAIEISPVALTPQLWQACDENRDAAALKDISIKVCTTRASVMSNKTLLNVILRNVASNAVKYTKTGGRILIGCRHRGDEVRIDVCDTGIGIAEDQLSRIFEAFNRVDSTRCEGLGLGLFIVRRAIDVLGHRITVSSAVSRGSRFSIFTRRVR